MSPNKIARIIWSYNYDRNEKMTEEEITRIQEFWRYIQERNGKKGEIFYLDVIHELHEIVESRGI